MRWRIALAFAIGASWLLYSLLPVNSELLRFVAAGLCFSVFSRAAAAVLNSLLSTQVRMAYRLRRDTSEAMNVVAERAREEVKVSYAKAEEIKRITNG